MSDAVIDNPILNPPFEETARHWRFEQDGITNEVVDGRRVSSYFVPIPTERQAGARPGIRLHTAPFGPDDWSWRHLTEMRVPVTAPARTIVDLLLDGEEVGYLERAVGQAFPGHDAALEELLSVARRRRHPSRTAKLLRDVRALADGAGAPTP